MLHHPQGFGLGNAGVDRGAHGVTVEAGESTYTELGVEAGLLGGLLFVAWSLALLARLVPRVAWLGAAFVAVLALGLQTDVIGVPWIAYVVWALAGDAIGLRTRDVRVRPRVTQSQQVRANFATDTCARAPRLRTVDWNALTRRSSSSCWLSLAWSRCSRSRACFRAARAAAQAARALVRASSTLTPGVLNPAVTQATIRSTICGRGWTRTIRPPVSYTNDAEAQAACGPTVCAGRPRPTRRTI